MSENIEAINAIRALMQFREDFCSSVPDSLRTQKADRDYVRQARAIRQRIERAINLQSEEYQGALSSGEPDGLSWSSSYASVFSATGTWFQRCFVLAPTVVASLMPQEEVQRPFGFAGACTRMADG